MGRLLGWAEAADRVITGMEGAIGAKQVTYDLARNEPSFRAVLDMPFAYYHIWARCFASNRWADGLSERERKFVERTAAELGQN